MRAVKVSTTGRLRQPSAALPGPARRRAGPPRSATSPSAPACPSRTWSRSCWPSRAPAWCRSKRGVGGGYVLARPPSEITLGQIVSRRRRAHRARRLRRAPPERRLRPRGPVRRSSPSGPMWAATCAAPRLLHASPTWPDGPGELPWPAATRTCLRGALRARLCSLKDARVCVKSAGAGLALEVPCPARSRGGRRPTRRRAAWAAGGAQRWAGAPIQRIPQHG